MDDYIKTIINGLKSWVPSCLSRLESSVSGSLATMADKLTSLSSKVQQAQTTATNAQTTADNAKTTANQAKSTADNAQSTAKQAQTTAETKAYSTLTTKGMFYLGHNVAANGQTLYPFVNAVYSGTSQGDFFVWMANFISNNTKNVQVSSVSVGSAVYASFENLVTINQGDIIRIRKGESDSVWKAELVGINLGYEALDTAYTEGVNSL